MAATAEPRRDLTGGDAACAAAALLAADAAWRRSPSASADLVLDGVRVRLRVAGDAVAGVVLPPLARVSEPPRGAPVAVLTAFDGAGSGERPAPPSGAPGRRSADAGVHLGFEPDAPLLSVYDPASASGAFWAEDAAAQHPAQLRQRGHGLHFVHGAVVGDERGGVLLAGPSRSGKSTTAMLCATRGMRHLGDDYVLVSQDGPPVAHALFATAKLDDAALRMLRLAAPAGPADEKIVLDPAASTPGGVAGRLPLRAVVLPRVGDRTGALEPVTPAAALAALAPSTLIQLAGSRAEDLASLAGLARTLPAYRLAVGPDLDAVLARVGEALEA
jgi:hypothetical protein